MRMKSRNEMGRANSTNGKKSYAYRLLVGKPEGKRPLRKRKRVCAIIRKMTLREIGWGVMGWINLAQDRDQWKALVNMIMNLLERSTVAAQLVSSQEWLSATKSVTLCIRHS
jgi:hypothetical protein